MCFMSGSIEMENVYVPENEAGMWQWLFGILVQVMGLLELPLLLLQEFSRYVLFSHTTFSVNTSSLTHFKSAC